MNNLPLAFLMGLLGSMHCAVMCGPLMLSLPLQKTNMFSAAAQVFAYQMGRILVYTLLGVLLGFIGNSFTLFANQQLLSLTIGVVLIVFTLLQFSRRYVNQLQMIQAVITKPISKLMGRIFGLPFWGFFAGMLNGLIPCGMVYLALATALNTATIKDGAVFMLLFGIGTAPLMLLISLGGIYLRRYINFNTQKLLPWFMLFMGALFILRAANLGIAFLSPNHAVQPNHKIENCR